MKKKFLTFLLAICLIIPCGIMLTACGKNPGGDTPPEPAHHLVTIRTLNNLNDKLESIDIFHGDREAMSETNIYSGTVKEGEENVFIRLTAKQSVKYTEEDVILIETDNNEFSKTIEVKTNGLTQNVIEITISNIKSECYFDLGLEDSNETHTIASMPIGYNYDIRYTASGTNEQVVLLGLEEVFYDIAIWSDKAERFVSYNDTKEDSTLNTKLGLENIKVNDFKVYVRFNDPIKFNSKTLKNLVVLRDTSGANEDISFTFNPQAITKGATKCYEYTLDIDKMQYVTSNSKIVLHYEKDLGTISTMPSEAELQVMMDYMELDGHKFSQTMYTDNLTENFEINVLIQEPSPLAVKKLNEEVTYKIQVLEDTEYIDIDLSKIDVYVGNQVSGIKATYDETDNCHYVKIPANAYPSTYGNAEYFYLTTAPSDTVEIIDDVINTENHTLVPVTTIVENEAMYKVTENDVAIINTDTNETLGMLWRTELSQDGKTQTQYFVVEKNAKDLLDNPILSLTTKFYYANYDDITVKVTFNGHVNYIDIDFKTLLRDGSSYGSGTLDLLCDDKHYNILDDNYISDPDTAYVEYFISSEYIEFKPIRLSQNDVYDGNGIKYEIISGTIGKSTLKGYSYYNDWENGGTEIEVDTDLVIKLDNEILTSTNGEYELERGVTYNFELTLQNLSINHVGSPFLIWNGFRVVDLNDYLTATFSYSETSSKFVGTICINSSIEGWEVVDCFTIGILYS